MCPEFYVGVGSIFRSLIAARAKLASNVLDGDIKADVEWFHRVLLVERTPTNYGISKLSQDAKLRYAHSQCATVRDALTGIFL